MKQEFRKIKDLFGKLSRMLNKQQRIYGLLVFVCTILSAVLETLGVSAILPVVEGLMDTESLWDKWYLQPVIAIFNVGSELVLIYWVCAGVILIYMLKNIYFIVYTWVVKKYTYKIKRELGTRFMDLYMKQGYIFFVENSSSRLLQGMGGDVAAVNNIISGIFILSTKFLSIVAIGIFIVLKEPLIAMLLLVLSAFCVTFMQMGYKNSMNKYGALLREAAADTTQVSLEAIQGSKEVLVTARQDYFNKRYADSLIRHANCSIKIDMASTIPAYLIEMICIIGLLVAVAIEVSIDGVSTELVGGLSIIAVAAFRIMPAVGAVTSQLNTLRSLMPSFNAAVRTINQVEQLEKEQKESVQLAKREGLEEIRFDRELELRDISYKYPKSEKNVLESLNLKIEANTSVGLIGSSGAGKTTLVDVLLGLLIPQRGTVLMDGIDIQTLGSVWNHNIGYVPQSVYLINDDIRSNIAFGIPREAIDDNQVWKVLEMAQLADFVKTLPRQLETIVGERGVKFSGGQRQRVAIARALYGDPEILVLDEATAALDNETESALMEAIDALQGHKTLIVVAHRLTTIRECDYIYEIKEGQAIPRTKADVFGAD